MTRTTRTAVFALAALALASCASFDPPVASRCTPAAPCVYTTITDPEDLLAATAVAASLHSPAMEAAIAAANPGEPLNRGRDRGSFLQDDPMLRTPGRGQ